MKPVIPHSRPTLGDAEVHAASEAIRSGQVAEGPCVSQFEAEMADYLGRAGAVAVSSGLAGLHLALLAAGVGPGDTVVVPSYNCAALAQAVHQCGAEVILCDVDPATGNPTPETVGPAIGNSRAVVVTHLFGASAEAKGVADLGPAVVEDLAQGLGARRAEGMAGRFGRAAVCSFYATKLMTSGGEGGMILSDDEKTIAFARDARSYDGREDLRPRWNYKLTDVQAAIGLAQLRRFEDFISMRREIASRYGNRLAGTSLTLPKEPPGGRHVYHRYVVGLPDSWVEKHGNRAPDEAVRALEAKGVGARRPIHKPLHHLMGKDPLPGAEAAWARHLSLPIYPDLTEEEADTVADAVCTLFPAEAA
jgi:dTDP-4-amino-4,6-dideoxygalactose transaminase